MQRGRAVVAWDSPGRVGCGWRKLTGVIQFEPAFQPGNGSLPAAEQDDKDEDQDGGERVGCELILRISALGLRGAGFRVRRHEMNKTRTNGVCQGKDSRNDRRATSKGWPGRLASGLVRGAWRWCPRPRGTVSIVVGLSADPVGRYGAVALVRAASAAMDGKDRALGQSNSIHSCF